MAKLLAPLMTHRYMKNGIRLYPRAAHQMTYLFCDEKGAPYKSLRTAWKNAKAAAGVQRKLNPHSMRHTFASHLLQAGANPVDVSKMLGHKQVSTTLDIYAHSSREGRERAFSKLPYLRRPEAEVIPLRKAVGASNDENLYAISGSKSENLRTEWNANLLKLKVGAAGFEPATSCSQRLGALQVNAIHLFENQSEIAIVFGALKTVLDPFRDGFRTCWE